ncbi:hypothetical protein OGAPHI_004584 [Ogataea philodendri]|uniref:Trafficking protein particle complex subunit 11 domain-containing protein n=1 Tax=Ogataea philodendri TaxID=1378263 RepID=A0A9P8T2W3_9ASCO|nr:uncharacterized protein OGAPHI_004584 [Ogataea philodendri]KAH3664233.1 hypothetical protein OGAPHI_004584 [Ogataea philodendri]
MSCQVCKENPFNCSLKCYKSETHKDPETLKQSVPAKELPTVDDPQLRVLLESPKFVQYLKEPVVQLNIRIILEILNNVSVSQESAKSHTADPFGWELPLVQQFTRAIVLQDTVASPRGNIQIPLGIQTRSIRNNLTVNAQRLLDVINRNKHGFCAHVRQSCDRIKLVLVHSVSRVGPVHDVVFPVESVRTSDLFLDDGWVFPVVFGELVERCGVWFLLSEIAERADPEIAVLVNRTLVGSQGNWLFEMLFRGILGHKLQLPGLEVILGNSILHTTNINVWIGRKPYNPHACAQVVRLQFLWVIQKNTIDGSRNNIHPIDRVIVWVGLGDDKFLFKRQKQQQFPPDKQITVPDPLSSENPLHTLLDSPTVIQRSIPTVQVASGLELAHVFKDHSIDADYWNNNEKSQAYNFKFVGSTYNLPHLSRPSSETGHPLSVDEHASNSPISPFNSDSKYYRSILPLEWIQKYTHLLPSVFISVHELDAESDANDKQLAQELNDIREKVALHGVKFLCLLLCSSPLTPEVEERVAMLRKTTRLPSRTGMLVLPAGTQKDLESFATVVMVLIKPWTADFYSAIERKIKKRQLLDPKYDEKLWLARQALKSAVIGEFKGVTEQTTKLLEYSYEKVMDVIRSLDAKVDRDRWNECRLLLDFIGLHVTRAYLFFENPNLAYKKFDIHIQNVLSVLPKKSIKTYPVVGWLCLQLTWLVQLVERCPDSTIVFDLPLQPLASSKWFGGPSDGLLMPHGGYLYLQAFSLLQRRQLQAESNPEVDETYMTLSPEEEARFDYHGTSIKLLTGALDMFARSKKTKFNRCESYVYYQLGEEHFQLGNYAMAVNNFLVALSVFKNEKWSKIVALILHRLYECCLKQENHKDAQTYYLQLCCLEDKIVGKFKNDIGTGFEAQELVVLKETLFQNQLLFDKPAISLHDKIKFQLYLGPCANSLMRTLVAERIDVQFADDSYQLSVEHSPELENTAFSTVTNGLANLDFSSKQSKVLEFELSPERIGKFKIDGVRLTLVSDKFRFENQLKLVQNTPDTFRWYRQSELFNKRFESEIVDGAQFEFEVIPKPPEVEVRVSHASICYQGEIVPITIHLKNLDESSFGLKLHATGNINTSSLKVTWNEEHDHNTTYRSAKALEPQESLDVRLFAHLPLLDTAEGALKLDLQVEYLIDNNENTVVRKSKSLRIQMVDLFNLSFQIHPSMKTHIPSPFNVVSDDLSAVPVHERVWRSRFGVENVSAENVTISNLKVEIVSSTPETEVQTTVTQFDVAALASRQTQDGVFEFLCRCLKNAFRRSVSLEIHVSFDYKFDGRTDNITNRYRKLLWKGTLPHMDPRTLVNVEQHNKLFKVYYVIENPTSRIFQFSTTLATSDKFKILNYKNQNNFSVLPFMKQVLRMEYELLSDGDWVKLPEFKIYDLNYKVYLNGQATVRKLQSRQDGLYVQTWKSSWTVSQWTWDRQNGLLAQRQLGKALFPTSNHHSLADSELERLVSVSGRVELLAVLQSSRVMDGHQVSWLWVGLAISWRNGLDFQFRHNRWRTYIGTNFASIFCAPIVSRTGSMEQNWLLHAACPEPPA